MSKRRTARTAGRRFLAVLGVLAVAGAVSIVAAAAAPPPAPTITSGPASPTSANSASFTYTDSAPITKFQCKLDSGSFSDCGTSRPSTKSYSGLSNGTHTFQVRAVSSGGTSSATPYTWVVDRTAPDVDSILRAGASPTNAASVQWTATFDEPVKGVDATDFALQVGGLGGSPSITGVAPNVTTLATSYTVTASTGTGSGSLTLKLVDNDSIRDAAGNKLGGNGTGNGNATGQTYSIDRTAPGAPLVYFGPLPHPPFGWPFEWATFLFVSPSSDATSYECSLDGASYAPCSSPKIYSGLDDGEHTFRARALDAAGNVSGPSPLWRFLVDTAPPEPPTLTQTPDPVTSSTTATFDWVTSDPSPGSGVLGYLCKLDDGWYLPCSRPKTYSGLEQGSHTFSIVAVDWAANFSDPTTFTWIVAEEGMPFTIAGDADGLLYPGTWQQLALTITNPNSEPIYVNGLTATVANDPAGCPNAGNVEIEQSSTSSSNELLVPAGATDWPVPPAFRPRLRLVETGANQDACQGAQFDLVYAGSAHS